MKIDKIIAAILSVTVIASTVSASAFARHRNHGSDLNHAHRRREPRQQKPSGDTGTAPSGTPPTGMPGGTAYTDVSSSAWYAQYVNYVTMKGVMTGSGSHVLAQRKITRAAFIEALYKAASSPDVTSTSSYADVTSSAEYYKAVCWSQENGITTGTKRKFLPNAYLTREMAMTFIYRGDIGP